MTNSLFCADVNYNDSDKDEGADAESLRKEKNTMVKLMLAHLSHVDFTG